MGGCSVAKIQPGENLRKIIAENGENKQSKQTMFAYSVANKNDSRYYDVNNYDIQSFEVFSEHKCTGKKWNKGRVQNLKETVLSSSVAFWSRVIKVRFLLYYLTLILENIC